MELYVNQYGASITRKGNQIQLKKADDVKHFSTEKLSALILSVGVKITTDAMAFCAQNQIDVVVVNRNGHPVGRFWSTAYGSIVTIRRNQLKFAESEQATQWLKEILIGKANNQMALLNQLKRDRPAKQETIESGIEFMNQLAKSIAELPIANINSSLLDTLRGYEGNISRKYFELISQIIPEEFKFERRSKHPAEDPFNAMLNYAYGILYNSVEGALIKAGLDPYSGIMHADEYNRPTLCFDFIETYRFWADAVVIQLCISKLVKPEWFTKSDSQVYIDDAAKKILVVTFNDYFHQVVQFNQKRYTRFNHITTDARAFAQQMLTFKTE